MASPNHPPDDCPFTEAIDGLVNIAVAIDENNATDEEMKALMDEVENTLNIIGATHEEASAANAEIDVAMLSFEAMSAAITAAMISGDYSPAQSLALVRKQVAFNQYIYANELAGRAFQEMEFVFGKAKAAFGKMTTAFNAGNAARDEMGAANLETADAIIEMKLAFHELLVALPDRHERAIAQILTRFRNMVAAAAEPVSRTATIEHATLNRMTMERETAALITEIEGLLALTHEIKRLWLQGPLRTPDGDAAAAARETQIDRQAAGVTDMYARLLALRNEAVRRKEACQDVPTDVKTEAAVKQEAR
ncbi:hypothetical protein F4780DRAFT_780845 [Xylariomycetidae sp. FL0641]|nr:hypothetical protein F4780DRAFT_780845 [Xylariomycetidae sp. FL0641]